MTEPLALTSFTYTIKGYQGGRVEVSYKDYSSCPTHVAIYNNVDFNGKIAFKIFSHSGLTDGYWEVNSIAFSGNASYTSIGFGLIGASVKVMGTQGLRFAAQINANGKTILEELDGEVEYGILLTNDTLGSLEIPCVKWFNDSQTIYTAVLTDLADEHATMLFTAKAYVKINNVKYYTESLTRSIAQLAFEEVNRCKTELDEENGFIYELEDGKFYDTEYTEEAFAYLKGLADKYAAQ